MKPMYQYGAADIGYGQRIQLGTSSPINLSGSSSYSIGFWLRSRAPAYDGFLLMSGTSFYIGQHGMRLSLCLPGMSSPPRSEIELLHDQWQYVLLSFESTGTSQGNYTLAVDGTPVIQGSLSHIPASSAYFSLGHTCDAQFCNVAFWSEALPAGTLQPVWDVPAPSSTLAACYSFIDGSPDDVSGHGLPAASMVNGAKVVMVAPSLRLTNAAALLSPRDALNVVANGAPFTVQGWFNAEAPSEFQAPDYTLFSCLDSSNGAGFSCGLTWGGSTGYITGKIGLPSGGGSAASGGPIQPGTWHHLAATYDGSSAVTLYLDGTRVCQVNGTLAAQQNPVWLLGARSNPDIAGGAACDFQGHLQAVGLWSRALSATEVQTYMSVDPTDAEGCVAYYACNGLIMANQVTGNPPMLINTAMPGLVCTPPSDSTPPPTPVLAEKRVPAPTIPGRDAVRWSSEEVPYPAQSPISRDEVQAMIDAYEPVLAAVPESMRGRLRNLFRNNLYLGLARGNGPGGLPVGAIAGKVVDGQYVFYHHTAEGPVECGRMELTVNTECIGWVISVVATAVCLLLSVIGVGYTASKAISALRPLVAEGTPLLNTLKTAITTGANDGAKVIRIIKALYIAGTFGKVLGAMLTGHWWTIALNCAMVILMVVGLFTTGGAYLAVVLAQIALNIITLIVVIEQKPGNCC